MYTIVRYNNREEWLEGRKKGIGASDVGTLLGLNKYNTPLRLWNKIMGLTAPEGESAAMSRGHRVEPLVASDFAAATGAIIDEGSAEDFHAVDNDKPWLRVSPDRMWWPAGTPESERTMENALILECKTCTADITPDTVFDHFPYWYAQIQYQMGVMGVQKAALGWICVGNPNLPFDYLMLDFDEKYYLDTIVPTVDAFWNDNVLGGAQPDQVLDNEDAGLRWSRAETGSKAVATQEVIDSIIRCRAIEAQIKALEKEADDIKLGVKISMGDSEALVMPDGKTEVATWKNCTTAARLDAKRLQSEQPDVYEKYMGQASESRRLLLKTPKGA